MPGSSHFVLKLSIKSVSLDKVLSNNFEVNCSIFLLFPVLFWIFWDFYWGFFLVMQGDNTGSVFTLIELFISL